MKTMTKKALSILMTFVMLLSYLSVGLMFIPGLIAYAEDSEPTEQAEAIDGIKEDTEEPEAKAEKTAPIANSATAPIAVTKVTYTSYNSTPEYVNAEFYYDGVTPLVKDIAVAEADGSDRPKAQLKGDTFDPGWFQSKIHYSEYIWDEKGPWPNIIDKDLNDGAKGQYIYMGYSTTNNPNEAITGLMFWNGSGINWDTYKQVTVNDKSIDVFPVRKWEKAREVVIDLNLGAGGDYIYAYYATDHHAGTPLVSITWEKGSTSENAANNYFVGKWMDSQGGSTAGTAASMNAGKKDNIFIYYTTLPTVDTTALRAKMDEAVTYINYYNNGERNYSKSSIDNLVTALNDAANVTNDYDSDAYSTAYNQDAITSKITPIQNALDNLELAVPLDATTNGGKLSAGTPDTINIKIGTKDNPSEPVNNLSNYLAEKDGWTFSGWDKSADKTSGSTSAVYGVTFNDKLYASYSLKLKPVYHYLDANGVEQTFSQNETTIHNNDTQGEVSVASFDGLPEKVTVNGKEWNLLTRGWNTDTKPTLPAEATATVTVSASELHKDYYAVYWAYRIFYENNIEAINETLDDSYQFMSVNGTLSNVRIHTYEELKATERPGFEFVGWSATEGGKLDDTYKPGTVLTAPDKDIKLYAVWHITNGALKQDTFVMDFGLPFREAALELDDIGRNRGAHIEIVAIAEAPADKTQADKILNEELIPSTELNSKFIIDKNNPQLIPILDRIKDPNSDNRIAVLGRGDSSNNEKKDVSGGTFRLMKEATENGNIDSVTGLREQYYIRYWPSSAMTSPDRIFYAVKYTSPGGEVSYAYSTVTVLPATSVYYEDSINVTVTSNGVEHTVDELISYHDGKISTGTPIQHNTDDNHLALEHKVGEWLRRGDTEYQLPTLTNYNASTSEAANSNGIFQTDSNYGYIDVYNQDHYREVPNPDGNGTTTYKNSYSMGSTHYVEVGPENNPNVLYSKGTEPGSWPYAQFTFAGTGFDVISVIGYTTGTIEVKVYKGLPDADGNIPEGSELVSSMLIDTYYTYTINKNGEWVPDEASKEALYQIPIISKSDLEYDTYTVQVTPKYSTIFDHENRGWYSFYLDAIRIYNPIQPDNSTEAVNYYAADGERSVYHGSIRPLIVSAGSLGFGDGGNLEGTEGETDAKYSLGTVFINGEDGNASFEDYLNYGPNNEVYLAKGQAIAFNLTTNIINPKENVAKIKISMHAPTNDNKDAMVVFGIGGKEAEKPITISSAATLYFDIPKDMIEWETTKAVNADDLFGIDSTKQNTVSVTKNPIVIANVGEGMLSLCDVKITTGNIDMKITERGVGFLVDEESAQKAVETVDKINDLGVASQGYFEPDELNAAAVEEKVLRGTEAEITIKTSSDVMKVLVDGKEAVLSEEADGVKTWTFSFVTGKTSGTETFEVITYSAAGNASDPITVTIDVQSRLEQFFDKLQGVIEIIVKILDFFTGAK